MKNIIVFLALLVVAFLIGHFFDVIKKQFKKLQFKLAQNSGAMGYELRGMKDEG